MRESKVWVTLKLNIAYPEYDGDIDNSNTWVCDGTPVALAHGYEVEILHKNESKNRAFIHAVYIGEDYYTWVDTQLLAPTPARYMVRQSTINPTKWEVFNTVWHQKTLGEYDSINIAQSHATNLNVNFGRCKIGAAWFSTSDGSWMVEIIPIECLKLLQTKPGINKQVEIAHRQGVSNYAEHVPLTSDEIKALNNGMCFTFHSHRNPYEVRIALFRIMRQRYKVEPMPPTN
ncbi:hypothetical protein NIES2101_39890 [Calothrix sp. HK-06]|nr:hypothetical protein NIES2101_39890 [Calothrix sp. HK-06]